MILWQGLEVVVMNKLWRISNRLYKKSKAWHPVARFFELLNMVLNSNAISGKAQIGENTRFHHHGLGCVIHNSTVIGNDCDIFQNVTIGSQWPNGICEGAAPVIKNRVLIGAGAVILGNVSIGDDAKIGANAVVIKDVPNGAVAVGVPAKIIKK